jgi:hypothetical protein
MGIGALIRDRKIKIAELLLGRQLTHLPTSLYSPRGRFAPTAHSPYAITNQTIAAMEIISRALWSLSHLHKTKANAIRPMQPSEAP